MESILFRNSDLTKNKIDIKKIVLKAMFSLNIAFFMLHTMATFKNT